VIKEANVVFEDVEFSYDSRKILDKVSFEVEAGKMVAIVGPTGAGKVYILLYYLFLFFLFRVLFRSYYTGSMT